MNSIHLNFSKKDGRLGNKTSNLVGKILSFGVVVLNFQKDVCPRDKILEENRDLLYAWVATFYNLLQNVTISNCALQRFVLSTRELKYIDLGITTNLKVPVHNL